MASNSSNSQTKHLYEQAQDLEDRISELHLRADALEKSSDPRNRVLSLIKQIEADPHDFNSLFECVLELASNPSLLPPVSTESREYRRVSNPFEIPRLCLIVATSFIESHWTDGFFADFDVQEFHRLRDWTIEVYARFASSQDAVPDFLWIKILKHSLFPRCCDFLSLETSQTLALWAQNWHENGLFSNENVSLFFARVAKPFMIDNLRELCASGAIHAWMELADSAGRMGQFAVIVREHVEKALEQWSPPSPVALELIAQWRHLLGNSGQFLYRAIGPKLGQRLALGDFDSFRPFMEFLPVDLAAGLVADCFISHRIGDIEKVAKRSQSEAAQMYIDIEKAIPESLLGNSKIVAKLTECLDRVKANNPILRGLRIEKEPDAATVGDLLQSIAANCDREFWFKGSMDGKVLYQLGKLLFGVSDGVIYLSKDRNWTPVLVGQISELIQ
jgi:hypothetical protein